MIRKKIRIQKNKLRNTNWKKVSKLKAFHRLNQMNLNGAFYQQLGLAISKIYLASDLQWHNKIDNLRNSKSQLFQ